MYKLPLPHELGAGEALRARVTVGTLRRGDTIVVRTAGGQIAGSVAPFGSAKPGQLGGVYTIPIPRDVVSGTTITLTLEVIASTPDSAARPPTSTEVENVDLEVIAVD